MPGKIPFVMIGAAGRMGQMILQIALSEPEKYEIVGAIEYDGHPLIGKPLSELIPGAPSNIVFTTTAPADAPKGTVAIHFALPDATMRHLDWSRQGGYPAAICTTGFSDEQLADIEAAASDAAMLLTPNTSLGVNVLFYLTQQAARLLGEDYDIEIVEMHHHHKKDAPSGTARRLAEVAAEVRGLDYDKDVAHGRQGIVGERKRNEIGMHALRGGDVVGDHTVTLAGPCERIELSHRAHSREVFAQGALKAAAWLSDKGPGYYSMKDVLGL